VPPPPCQDLMAHALSLAYQYPDPQWAQSQYPQLRCPIEQKKKGRKDFPEDRPLPFDADVVVVSQFDVAFQAHMEEVGHHFMWQVQVPMKSIRLMVICHKSVTWAVLTFQEGEWLHVTQAVVTCCMDNGHIPQGELSHVTRDDHMCHSVIVT